MKQLHWIWFWLAAGNCIGAPTWDQAFERTYFQAIAIIGVWFVSVVRRMASTTPHVLRPEEG